jgi:sulfur-carrier protein adenylyltransferase/sulfurtransferase
LRSIQVIDSVRRDATDKGCHAAGKRSDNCRNVSYPGVMSPAWALPPLVEPSAPLFAQEIERCARQVLIPDVGVQGQRRLKNARVLVVGAAGLGSPALVYLAAAGVGTTGVADPDVVELSNLQRQVVHRDADVARLKSESAAQRLASVNPLVRVVRHDVRIDSRNALQVIADSDLVLDGTDNFPTRYLLNDACVLLGKPDVWGSIDRFDGQASIWWAKHGPCYRWVFPEPPPPGLVAFCDEGEVLGVVWAAVGSIQALEAVKLIVGIGDPLVGRLMVHDALRQSWDILTVHQNPDCAVCGQSPTVTELVDYEAFCSLASLAGAGMGDGTVLGPPPSWCPGSRPSNWLICSLAGGLAACPGGRCARCPGTNDCRDPRSAGDSC